MLKKLNDQLTKVKEELSKMNSFENKIISINEWLNWLQDRESEKQEQEQTPNNELEIYDHQKNKLTPEHLLVSSIMNKRKHSDHTKETHISSFDNKIQQYLVALID